MIRWKLIALGSLVLAIPLAFGQQRVDPDFDVRVAHPAYSDKHPKVLFDEAHHNFETASGRYKPFADLIRNDGYEVVPNKKKFSASILTGSDVLIVANALSGEGLESYWTSAFASKECDAVRDWVRAGGSLLLIADPAPFGAGAEKLAASFGVDMSKGVTSDPVNHDPESQNRTFLLFSRENHLLLDHPITRGRNDSESLKLVLTFTGQSLKGPEGSVPFLKLADTAVDRAAASEDQINAVLARGLENAIKSGGVQAVSLPTGKESSAAGRAQALAFEFGKGRVVVFGETVLLSAQIVTRQPAKRAGKEKIPMGMNRPGTDDRQLALNVMHWLTRMLN